MAIFRWKPPNGASNAGRIGKNRDFRRTAGYRSITSGVRTTTATVDSAIYHTDCHASVNFCLLQPAWTTTTKRRERNRNYLYTAITQKTK